MLGRKSPNARAMAGAAAGGIHHYAGDRQGVLAVLREVAGRECFHARASPGDASASVRKESSRATDAGHSYAAEGAATAITVRAGVPAAKRMRAAVGA
jgi:hypothetical protein